jgi:hypothetical protein
LRIVVFELCEASEAGGAESFLGPKADNLLLPFWLRILHHLKTLRSTRLAEIYGTRTPANAAAHWTRSLFSPPPSSSLLSCHDFTGDISWRNRFPAAGTGRLTHDHFHSNLLSSLYLCRVYYLLLYLSQTIDVADHQAYTITMSYADPGRAPQAHLSREEAPQEPTGAIASDSLAAESVRAGGGFSENENADVMGVKGGQSTLNTTDTSGASVLHPASSGADREKQDAMGLGSDEKGAAGTVYPDASGQPEFDGSTNLDGYTGGSSSGKASSGYDTTGAGGGSTGAFDGDSGATPDAGQISSSGGSAGNTSGGDSGFDGDASGPSEGAGVRPFVETAPVAQSGILPPGSQQPKGTNITEGGVPATKTFTGNVGGEHDPGRLAEKDFQKINANADRGAGQQETGEVETGDKGGFEVLESERI